MAGAAEVVAAARDARPADRDVTLWALVPNAKGAELATAAGVDHLTITVSASPAYSEKNVHMTIAEAQAQVAAIRGAAPDAVLDEVISCCFGSPFDGRGRSRRTTSTRSSTTPATAGIDQVTLADTTGMATPRRIAVGARRRRHRRRPAPPRHPGHGAASTRGRRSSTASGASTPRSAGSAARRSPRRPAATSPPRTSCWCSTTPASRPASTSTRLLDAGAAARRPRRPRRSRAASPAGRRPIELPSGPRRRRCCDESRRGVVDAAGRRVGRRRRSGGSPPQQGIDDFAELIRWSIADVDGFWAAATEFTGVRWIDAADRRSATATRCPASAGSRARR